MLEYLFKFLSRKFKIQNLALLFLSKWGNADRSTLHFLKNFILIVLLPLDIEYFHNVKIDLNLNVNVFLDEVVIIWKLSDASVNPGNLFQDEDEDNKENWVACKIFR